MTVLAKYVWSEARVFHFTKLAPVTWLDGILGCRHNLWTRMWSELGLKPAKKRLSLIYSVGNGNIRNKEHDTLERETNGWKK